MNIYVGNLPHSSTEAELREAFEKYGSVSSATIIKDKFSGDSRGFGFVEMPSKSEAQEALANLDGRDFGGRKLNVNEAKPREERSNGFGGGKGGGRRY